MPSDPGRQVMATCYRSTNHLQWPRLGILQAKSGRKH